MEEEGLEVVERKDQTQHWGLLSAGDVEGSVLEDHFTVTLIKN